MQFIFGRPFLNNNLRAGDCSPIFIGGAGRSGTTLLRVILDSHPNIVCGPELKVTPNLAQMWFDFQRTPSLGHYYLLPNDINSIFAQLFLSLVEKYRVASGKKRIAEKSPHNVFYFRCLSYMFPKSPLVHMIRDGRDVICSLLTMDWYDPMTDKPVDYTRDVRKAAEYWVLAVRKGREARADPVAGRNYIEIYYEKLIQDPEATLKELFAFLHEPWDPVVLTYYKQGRNLAEESSADQVSKPLYKNALKRWAHDLTPDDKEIVKEVAGNLLIELGYANDLNW